MQILRRIKRRPGRNGIFGHGKHDGQDMNNGNNKVDDRIAKAGGIPPKGWTLHDIRRTFRTRIAGLGVTTDVAEALVGHVGHRNQIERTYNQYKYWAEMRQAVAMWEANLRAIIDGTAEKTAHPRFGKKGDAA
jgi:integrase